MGKGTLYANRQFIPYAMPCYGCLVSLRMLAGKGSKVPRRSAKLLFCSGCAARIVGIAKGRRRARGRLSPSYGRFAPFAPSSDEFCSPTATSAQIAARDAAANYRRIPGPLVLKASIDLDTAKNRSGHRQICQRSSDCYSG